MQILFCERAGCSTYELPAVALPSSALGAAKLWWRRTGLRRGWSARALAVACPPLCCSVCKLRKTWLERSLLVFTLARQPADVVVCHGSV